MNELKQFFSYIRRPQFTLNSQLPNTSNLSRLGLLLIVEYAVSIAWIFTVNRWIKQHYDIERSTITEDQVLGEGLFFFFLTVVVAYPLVEELIFRYFLKGKPFILFLMGGLVIGAFMYMGAKELSYPSLLWKRTALLVSAFAPLLLLLISYLRSSRRGKLQQQIVKYFPFIFYGSTLAFAVLHIANFDWSGNQLLMIPFIVPQLLSGLLYGYSRMKYGLWASILLHASSNAITFVFDQILGL